MSRTPKQTLWAHIRETHSQHHAPSERATLADLQKWHANQHHRYWTNHYHEGPNRGVGERPPGWRTGEGAVRNH